MDFKELETLPRPMSRSPRRRYTDDQKAQAVILVESIGPTAAARQLNVAVKSLANWL